MEMFVKLKGAMEKSENKECNIIRDDGVNACCRYRL